MPPPFGSRTASATREEEWRDLPGSAGRTCVDVALFQDRARRTGPNARDLALELRSGEFVAGDFFEPARPRSSVSSASPGDPAFVLKLYWFGLARELQSPRITAENLSDPSTPVQRGSGSSAANAGGTFTASEVPLPSRGRWRIIAASTDQWGCYEVVI
jgi:hypothetical protein